MKLIFTSIIMACFFCAFSQDGPNIATLQAGRTFPLTVDRNQPPVFTNVVNPNALYSNVTTFTGATTNGNTAVVNGDTVTSMVVDDLTLVNSPSYTINQFMFSAANYNSTATNARFLVSLYADNGGRPGNVIVSYTFGVFSLPALVAQLFTVTTGPLNLGQQKIWAGVAFSTGGGGATIAQMNNLGQANYNPVNRGSSADNAFRINPATSPNPYSASNPSGSTFSYSGNPVANYGWEFVSSTALPTAFTGCPNTNLAIARAGYNTYNGEPVQMYNIDTTTGASTLIAGGPLKNMITGANIDVNGAGLNAADGLVYAIRDTLNTARTAAAAILYRVGSNYSNIPLGNIPPPTTASGESTELVNPAAGGFDDQGNYYFIAVGGNVVAGSFTPKTYYLGKIANVASLTFGGTITPTYTPINFGGTNCSGFLTNLLAPVPVAGTGTAAGTGIQDITYSNLYKSIYFYEAFQAVPGVGNYTGQLISVNPTTGVATCYAATTPLSFASSKNEVSGISTTANGSLLVFFTSGDVYKTNVLANNGAYTGAITKIGTTSIAPLAANMPGSVRGDFASCGVGSPSLPTTRSLGSGADAQLVNGARAYPNPVSGLTTVSVLYPLSNATVRVLGSMGNVISETNGVSGYSFQLNMTSKPGGLYLVEVIQGGNVQQVKLVKR